MLSPRAGVLTPKVPTASVRLRWNLLWGLLILAVACRAEAQEVAEITIRGSDTMLVLNEELAASYRKAFPGRRVSVAGGGSRLGLKELVEGKTLIAASSARMDEETRAAFRAAHGIEPMEMQVAIDGVGIYVHDSNPVQKLTMKQVARIFQGEERNWKGVGSFDARIDVYTRNKQSGTRRFIRQTLFPEGGFHAMAREVATTTSIISAVSRNRAAIGYGGIAYAPGARVLRIAPTDEEDAIWPNRENVTSGRYPLSRPLYYYLHPASRTPAVEIFLRWVVGREGRKLVEFVGYFVTPEEVAASALETQPILLRPGTIELHDVGLRVESSGGEVVLSIEAGGTVGRRLTSATLAMGGGGEGGGPEKVVFSSEKGGGSGVPEQIPLPTGSRLTLVLGFQAEGERAATIRYLVRADDFVPPR